MPILSKGTFQQNYNSDSGTSEFRNPKSIWRNTVRIRPGEFAVIKFVTDFISGDMSKFHGIPGMTAKGQQFTSYEYCNRLNVNMDDGTQIVSGTCEHCGSADERIAKTTSRYLTWVLHYGSFHVDQNPFYDGQREDQVAWDQVKKGNKVFFKENVKKPQLLNTSYTLFKNIEEKYDRYSTLLDRTFDYSSSRPSNITQYNLELSDTNIQNDFSQEIIDMATDLPDLEKIAAKLIVEVDLPILGEPAEQSVTAQKYEDAFANMANLTNEEL